MPTTKSDPSSSRRSSGSEDGAAPPSATGSGIRVRALLLAVPLIVLDAFWVMQAEQINNGPFFTTITLFANAFFILMVLMIGNALARRLGLHRAVLSQAELLLIHAMVSLGAAFAGLDMVPGLIQMLGYPYRFGTGAFGEHLPRPLMVPDPKVLAGYYEGYASFYTPANLRAWAVPAALWTGFVIVLFWTMMCLNVLMRKGWQDRERLPFPIVEIPLMMTEPSGALWRNRLFWAGFALSAGIEILNGLNWLYPTIPGIPIKQVDLRAGGAFADRPWSAVGWTPYSFYPFAIGLGYLLPLDLLFSCWFFYLFWKAQKVASAAMAWDITPDFPFIREQAFGGFLAILAFLLYNGRNYFKEMVKKVFGEPSELDDRTEALSYRQATLGFLGGMALLVGFMAWAGLSPRIAAAVFLIYFALSLVVTRIRAELGPPVHDLHFTGPDHILTRTFGMTAFTERDLTVLTFFYWFNRAYRSHPMPFGIEGLKAARQVGASQRTMFWALLLAAAVGTAAAFWAYLHLAYALGTQPRFLQKSFVATEAYNRLTTWLSAPTPPNTLAGGAIGFGFAFCSALMLARIQFPWWPFHPIGYAISGSWSINLFWVPLFIAWLLKTCLMRYGGIRAYNQGIPVFLGLILGQFVVGCLWQLLGLALGITPYSFWSN